MLMMTPGIALADWTAPPAYQADAFVPAVTGLQIVYWGERSYLVWSNHLSDTQRMYIEYSTDAQFSWNHTMTRSVDGDAAENGFDLSDLTPEKSYSIGTIICSEAGIMMKMATG